MIHFEGDRDFSQPPAALWDKLSDARFLVQCIPGLESVARAEPRSATCVLRPGFSFVRGTLELTLRLEDDVPGCSLRLALDSRGIGSSSTVAATLDLHPLPAGTRVHWAADVTQLGGLLKAVPQGLIRASAQKVIADVWASIEARLQAQNA